MRLVVQFEDVVSIGEVLLGLRFYLCVSRNPVEKFGAVTGVFGVSRLIRLESFVMSYFFVKCSFVTSAKCPRKLIATDKSRSIQHSPTSHNRDTCHCVIYYSRVFFKSLISDAGGKDFLVLEVLFERNAARHDGGELHVIHRTAAGVRSKILFHNLFLRPSRCRRPNL